MGGARNYHPALYRGAGEWDGKDNAMTLVTGSHLVGICSLSREASIDLSLRCPAIASSIEELLAWLSLTHFGESEAGSGEEGQRILNEPQRQLAAEKWNGWLVKPTDGILGRANRRISI